VFIVRWKDLLLHPHQFPIQRLVDVTAHLLIGSTPIRLGAVEVLGPTGTVGLATGLLAPTFDEVSNCRWSWRISCWDWHYSIPFFLPPMACCW